MDEVTDLVAAARDGKAQPCSGPMTREVADWYVQYTCGQLQAFLHEDGNRYLYASSPQHTGRSREHGRAHQPETGT
jgi:hypothetical protein